MLNFHFLEQEKIHTSATNAATLLKFQISSKFIWRWTAVDTPSPIFGESFTCDSKPSMEEKRIKFIHWQCSTLSPPTNQLWTTILSSSHNTSPLQRHWTTRQWWLPHILKQLLATWDRIKIIKVTCACTVVSFTRGSTALKFTSERTPDSSRSSVDTAFGHSVIQAISTSTWNFTRIKIAIRILPRQSLRMRNIWLFSSTVIRIRRRVKVIDPDEVSFDFSFISQQKNTKKKSTKYLYD